MSRVAMVLSLYFLFSCFLLGHAHATDYVVNTNWANGQYSPGVGCEPDNIHSSGFLPSYNSYLNSVTDNLGVTETQRDTFISTMDLLYPEYAGIEIYKSLRDIPQEGLNGGVAEVQLIVNHAIDTDPSENYGGGMFSIFLPPGFDTDNPYRYPIVFNSPGYGGVGTISRIFDLPASGTYNPVAPNGYIWANEYNVVCVYFNGGGSDSMAVNSQARTAVAECIDMLYTNYHCDKEKVITLGESRGAFASMTIAENNVHEIYDYNVIGVFCHAVPCSVGELGQMPISTYPTFISMYSGILNLSTRYNSTDPYYNSPEIFRPAFGPAVDDGEEILSFDSVNEMCPDYSENLARLADKYIFIGYGTHDGYFPLKYAIAMDNQLSDLGIEHSFVYCLRTGHGPSTSALKSEVLEDFLGALHDHLEDPENIDFSAANYEPPAPVKKGLGEGARNYLEDLDTHMHYKNNFRNLFMNEFPFTATFPYRLGCNVHGSNFGGGGTFGLADEPGIVHLSGAADSTWEVTLTNPDMTADPRTKTWGPLTFDASETDTIEWWPTPESRFPVEAHWTPVGDPPAFDGDRLEWEFVYNGESVPGDNVNWAWYDGQNTIPLPLETKIIKSQPFPSALYAWNDTANYDPWDPSGEPPHSKLIGIGVDLIPELEPLFPYIKCTPREIDLSSPPSGNHHYIKLHMLVGNNTEGTFTDGEYSIDVVLPNQVSHSHVSDAQIDDDIDPEDAIVVTTIDDLKIHKGFRAMIGTNQIIVTVSYMDGSVEREATATCELTINP